MLKRVWPLLVAMLLSGCHSHTPPVPMVGGSVPTHTPGAGPSSSDAPGGPNVINGVITNRPRPDSNVTPGWARGTVPPRDGHPVWASIDFHDADGHLVQRIKTDSQGSFQVSLPPGTYSVISRSNGDHHDAHATLEVMPGGQTEVRIGRPDH